MSRRSLDDDIYGDRSSIRKHKNTLDEDWNDDFFGQKSDVWGGSKGFGSSCYETHPPLPLPGGSGWQIFGGSCIRPIVKDADVYIGFDGGMRMTARSWPWKQGQEFLFEINDRCAPSNAAEFKKLVAWTLKQLETGVKIHAGCIGGHGRTGTFLAALVAELGEKDAVSYVRKNYCPRAVETDTQIGFLVEHFGVKAVKGRKAHGSTRSKGGGKIVDLASATIRIGALTHNNHDRIW